MQTTINVVVQYESGQTTPAVLGDEIFALHGVTAVAYGDDDSPIPFTLVDR
jgi:hypothetical protein